MFYPSERMMAPSSGFRSVGAFRRALSDELQTTILRESLTRYRRTRVGTKGGGKRILKRYSKGSGVAMGAMRRFGSDRERRRRRANALYEFEMVLREEGISDFVYDEEKDLFRFPDGRFAFSRKWADVDLLQERG
jgi:hypothetical protein